MATNNPQPSSSSSSKIKNSNEEQEEEYIDMEVTSSSPQISREFEFQMSSVSINDKVTTTTTSPADELFYRGKLLPLHLPPRLEMVQKLLQTSSKIESFQLVQEQQEENFSISTKNLTNTRTPFESCNQKTSKIESFQVVQEQEQERFSISTKNLANPRTPFESCNQKTSKIESFEVEQEIFSISTKNLMNARTPFDSCKQKLLQTSKIESFQVLQEQEEERFSISTKNLMNARTPFDSCNISPSKIESFQEVEEERFSVSTKSLISTTNTSTTFDQSCNISPSESCRVSCELNPDEYFFEWSNDFSIFFKDNPTKIKSWSKKLKLVKQSLISQKLKSSTSKAYLNLKSLFNKSTCSDQEVSNGTKECPNKYIKVSKKKPFGHIGKCTQNSPTLASVIRDIDSEDNNVNSHRRSFSAAIKKHSPTKCLSSSTSDGSSSSSSSSSFSLNSNGFYELNFLKSSRSATTEIEGSIEAAIAHCKKSQELCNPKRKMMEAGINSLYISKIAATEIQERPDLCRF
ncbi:hypothetical protein RND71_038766 [Anisodus tanguticus]|uniref:Membrane-associated kinase regulator 4 n=1 Tax=Anisodus tanguticus TaxID=243964 RepID=A0AAE1R098_9SOLA|nr:hypothetical protein RND71_038766 [Anisodus tanguticus]